MNWKKLPYANDLKFSKELIEQYQINFIISEEPYTDSIEYDTFFRKNIYKSQDFQNLFLEKAKAVKPNTIYRITDNFMRNFFSLMLPDTEINTIVIIGPFVLNDITNDKLHHIAEIINISPTNFSEIESYYNGLTRLHDDIPILACLHVLGNHIWGGIQNYQIVDYEYSLPVDVTMSYSRGFSDDFAEPILQIQMLEQRYKLEQELMNAVSHGQIHQAELIQSRFISSQRVEIRTPNLIRNLKNYMVILNTLLRKAAETGYVHPLHIDKLSSQIARKIEQLDYDFNSNAFAKDMVRKYCMLVRNYSLRKYSEIVRNTLTIITSDLTSNLTLKELAQKQNINASYLSTLFKKELDMTLTEYVTKKRVEHAVFLLNSTSMQIANVAVYCGIPDVQYFSKLFKKQIGVSPSDYRKGISEKI